MATRPRTIRVGPFVFDVDWTARGWAEMAQTFVPWDADASRYYGFTDRGSCRIWVNPHASEQFQREALLHEVIHACQAVAGLPNSGAVGEDFVTRVTPVLLDTLDRNAALRRYLFP